MQHLEEQTLRNTSEKRVRAPPRATTCVPPTQSRRKHSRLFIHKHQSPVRLSADGKLTCHFWHARTTDVVHCETCISRSRRTMEENPNQPPVFLQGCAILRVVVLGVVLDLLTSHRLRKGPNCRILCYYMSIWQTTQTETHVFPAAMPFP